MVDVTRRYAYRLVCKTALGIIFQMLDLNAAFQTVGYIVVSLGGGGIVVAALASWLGDILAKRILLKDKKAVEEGLRKLESKLQLLAHKEAVVFDSLHDRRASAVAKSFALIAQVKINAQKAVRPELLGHTVLTPTESFNEAAAALDSFFEHFEKNRIYFSQATAATLSTFVNNAWQVLDDIRIFAEDVSDGDEPVHIIWQKADSAAFNTLRDAVAAVESEYRGIVGVEDVSA